MEENFMRPLEDGETGIDPGDVVSIKEVTRGVVVATRTMVIDWNRLYAYLSENVCGSASPNNGS